MIARERIRADVEAALETVLDPCSVYNGTRLSLPELGMIDRVEVGEHGDVVVGLFLDDPTCIFFFEITRMIKEAVAPLAGVASVDFEIKADEIWTEDRMRPVARERLEGIRRERRDLHARDGAAAGWPLPMVASGSAPPARRPEARTGHALPMMGGRR
jgi:metal-sulfur cluster biosynthetic enzyme